MIRGDIKKGIKNEVDDQTVDDTLLNTWVQRADEKVQGWRPANDQNQTFDYWDYLKPGFVWSFDQTRVLVRKYIYNSRPVE
jgi:hypothetical protein